MEESVERYARFIRDIGRSQENAAEQRFYGELADYILRPDPSLRSRLSQLYQDIPFDKQVDAFLLCSHLDKNLVLIHTTYTYVSILGHG